jgi:hypothetical protein
MTTLETIQRAITSLCRTAAIRTPADRSPCHRVLQLRVLHRCYRQVVMSLRVGSPSYLRSRRVVRAGLAGLAWVVVCVLVSGLQPGCLSTAYFCGSKNSTCTSIPGQSACEQHATICEWRVGCASGCRHAQTVQECAQHLACGTDGVSVCTGFSCMAADGGGLMKNNASRRPTAIGSPRVGIRRALIAIRTWMKPNASSAIARGYLKATSFDI